MIKRNPLIYITGPYTGGNKRLGINGYATLQGNAESMLAVAERVLEIGWTPVVPLLSHFWNRFHPHEEQFWHDYDKQLLLRCDAVYRMIGESPGADDEVKLAEEMKLPVYYEHRDGEAMRQRMVAAIKYFRKE